LHLLDQVQRPGNRQPAQSILAFKDRNPGLQLVFEKHLLVIRAQHLVNRGIERSRQPVNR
jgi:hypothetical protein